jgi:hypothetical protein
MSQPVSDKRVDWMRRWFGLLSGIALCLLLLSTYSPEDSRGRWAFRLILAAVILALGIYEFVRPKTQKPGG